MQPILKNVPCALKMMSILEPLGSALCMTVTLFVTHLVADFLPYCSIYF